MPASDPHVRLRLAQLEHEALAHRGRHLLRLMALLALGYSYPLLVLLLSLALIVAVILLAPLVARQDVIEIIIAYLVLLVVVLLATGAVLRAFWVSVPPPQDDELPEHDWPDLWATLREVAASARAPMVHRVHIDVALNAGTTRLPRRGLFGSPLHLLRLGMPLMLCLSRQQFCIVLVHELGHMRGDHTRILHWIYQSWQTWEQLSAPIQDMSWWRKLVSGWFYQWYGRLLTVHTLPMRRLHEYEADSFAAQLFGVDAVAQTLMSMSWLQYRMSKEFLPALHSQAALSPVPPDNMLQQMRQTLQQPAEDVVLERWRAYQLLQRTPIDSDHPCLRDRLETLGCAELLRQLTPQQLSLPQESAAEELGLHEPRLMARMNATWKALAIAEFRRDHELTKAAAKAAADYRPKALDPAGHQQWLSLQPTLLAATPTQRMQCISEFLQQFPQHSYANYMMGHELLAQQDEAGIPYLESAMAADSDATGPALHCMLTYFRDMGRDEQAEPIRLRLQLHEKAMAQAHHAAISKNSELEPHGLSDHELAALVHGLRLQPRIRRAYLVRLKAAVAGGKPRFVLAVVRRPRLLQNASLDKFLINEWPQQLELPCSVVILSRQPKAMRERIQAVCPVAIYDDLPGKTSFQD